MNPPLGAQEDVAAANHDCVKTWCAALRSRDYRITETRCQLVDPGVNKVPYFYHDVHE